MSIENDVNGPIKWKERAEALFFVDHLGMNEIAVQVKKARETVSRYISGCIGYEMEMDSRKRLSKEKRREYQRQWDQDNRKRYLSVDGASLRREHDMAAYILSKERFCKD